MKRILCVLFVAVMLLGLAACGGGGGKLEQIKKDGTLTVYTDPNFPPFEYTSADGIVGVDIEIAKAIAAEMGVELDVKEGIFDSIVMSLKGGKGDISLSGLTITDERKESVDFSDPYIKSVQYLILNDGTDYKTVESLTDKKIGVAKGYTGSLLIDYEINNEEGGVLYGTNTTFTEYPSGMEATLDLKNGKVDAVVMDEYVAKNIVANTDGVFAQALSYDSGDLAEEEYGVAVPKGNEDLLEVINGVIKKLKDEGKIEAWVIELAM